MPFDKWQSKYVPNIVADTLPFPKMRNNAQPAISIYEDPLSVDLQAKPEIEPTHDYAGRNLVSDDVSYLLDTWVAMLVKGDLHHNQIAYRDQHNLWCSVTHMAELIQSNSVGAGISHFLYLYCYFFYILDKLNVL